MPVGPKPHVDKRLPSFFEGLIPEGWLMIPFYQRNIRENIKGFWKKGILHWGGYNFLQLKPTNLTSFNIFILK